MVAIHAKGQFTFLFVAYMSISIGTLKTVPHEAILIPVDFSSLFISRCLPIPHVLIVGTFGRRLDYGGVID